MRPIKDLGQLLDRVYRQVALDKITSCSMEKNMPNKIILAVQNFIKEHSTLFISFALNWLIICLILIANELILRYLFNFPTFDINNKHFIPYVFIALGFSLINSHKHLLLSLISISLLQMVWFGSYRYFGTVLNPDAMIMGFYEMDEVGEAMVSEWQVFITPIIAVLLLNLILLTLLQQLKLKSLVHNTKLGLLFVALPFLVVSIRSSLHSHPFLLTPSTYMSSQTGVVQALTLALRHTFSLKKFDNRNAARVILDKNPEDMTKQQVTVALIIGESISPMELGLFGGSMQTTPLLTKRLKTQGALSYYPKVGFAAGAATLASVPLTLRMSHNPIRSYYNSRTLFEIAKKQKFSVGYYAAQKRKSVLISGGLQFIDQSESYEDWIASYEQKADDIIFEQIAKSPITGNNRFFFIHQRTNHTPYECDIKTALEPNKKTRKNLKSYAPKASKRLERYQKGLLCHDRSLDKLFAFFEKQPGAVYVFFASDHNELMGEHNIWGHGNMNIQTSLIPMMLATNRPNSPVAQKFSKLKVPSAFEFSQLVAESLGQKIRLDPPSNKFYVNGVLAFGRRGYFELERTTAIDRFKVTIIKPNQAEYKSKEITLLGLKDIYQHLLLKKSTRALAANTAN